MTKWERFAAELPPTPQVLIRSESGASSPSAPVTRKSGCRRSRPSRWIRSPGFIVCRASADPPADSLLLDLGCGAGLDSLLIAPSVHFVIGIDFSDEMLRLARDSARAAPITNVEFRLGDAERIPAEQGSFDAAVINGIFNLNSDRSQMFQELARVVRPGGMVFAAKLILKAPLRAGVEPSREDWFG